MNNYQKVLLDPYSVLIEGDFLHPLNVDNITIEFPSNIKFSTFTPSKETYTRDMWKSIVANTLEMEDIDSEQYPERWENALCAHHTQLKTKDLIHIVLFKNLSWIDHTGLRTLFQLALDFNSFSNIKLKCFVTSEIIDDSYNFCFPDASKLLAQKIKLIKEASC